MASRPTKRLKRQNSGTKGDEPERVFSQHKDTLQEKMMSFLEGLAPLTTRFIDYSAKVRADNPYLEGASNAPERLTHTPVAEAKDLPSPPVSHVLLQHLSTIKKESFALSQQLSAIAEWIALMVPTIKDEDNAGVEVWFISLPQEGFVLQVNFPPLHAMLRSTKKNTHCLKNIK